MANTVKPKYQNEVIQINNAAQNSRLYSVDKEETSSVKSEHPWLSQDEKYQYDVEDNSIKVEETNSSETENERQPLQDENFFTSLKHISDLKHNEIIDSDYCKEERVVLSKSININNLESTKLEFDLSLQRNLSLDKLNKCSDPLNQSADLKESCDDSTNVVIASKPRKRKSKFIEYYIKHYEKKAEILENPDCQRIISTGMSRQEKNRESVLCRECGKTLKFRYYVSVHLYTHLGMKPFKCDVCSASFAKQNFLRTHMLIHTDTKNFSCDICSRPFRTSQAVEAHKKTHSDERSYPCNICGKKLKYKETLKQHILAHNNVKTHTCELCGKSFMNGTGLQRHKLTHNTERTFMCTICGKGYTSKRGLNEHRKLHSDNKPYVCSYCDSRFKCNTVLQSHILIHTGEKPFSCKICGRAFRQRPSLRHHMRTHTGETPFECNLCPSKFKYQQQLTSHRKVHKNKSQ